MLTVFLNLSKSSNNEFSCETTLLDSAISQFNNRSNFKCHETPLGLESQNVVHRENRFLCKRTVQRIFPFKLQYAALDSVISQIF